MEFTVVSNCGPYLTTALRLLNFAIAPVAIALVALLFFHARGGKLRAFWLLGLGALPFIAGGVFALGRTLWPPEVDGRIQLVLEVPPVQHSAASASAVLLALVAGNLLFIRGSLRLRTTRRITIVIATFGGALAAVSSLRHGYAPSFELQLAHRGLDLLALTATGAVGAALLRRRRVVRRFWLRAIATTAVAMALLGDLFVAPTLDEPLPPLVAMSFASHEVDSASLIATPDALCDEHRCRDWNEVRAGRPREFVDVALGEDLLGLHLNSLLASTRDTVQLVGDDPRMRPLRWAGFDERHPILTTQIWTGSVDSIPIGTTYLDVRRDGEIMVRPLLPEGAGYGARLDSLPQLAGQAVIIGIDDEARAEDVVAVIAFAQQAGASTYLWRP